MNTNPQAIRILCYGDSNTWGSNPARRGLRFGKSSRWTALMQAALGPEYEVVEAGLRGRNTDMHDPQRRGRNGRRSLQTVLGRQDQLSYAIIMLGTNDTKNYFARSSQDIGKALEGLLEDIKDWATRKNYNPPRLIVVAHVSIDEVVLDSERKGYFDRSSIIKSRELVKVIENVAKRHNALFFDANTVARPGGDGVHIDKTGHRALAEALTKLILSD